MAENAQPAARGGGATRGGRGRGRGRGGGFAGMARNTGSFDPEHPAMLLDKWSKKLGRDLESIEVKYTANGVQVFLNGTQGQNAPFASLQKGSVQEYRRLAEVANAQTPAQKLTALRRKYEDRVGDPPAGFPTQWEDQAVEAWINGLPLEARRRLRMSQKQFLELHPNGQAV